MQKILILILGIVALAVTGRASEPDQATVFTVFTVSTNLTINTNTTRPVQIAPARLDRIGLKILHLTGGEDVTYGFSTNSLTYTNGFGNLAAGSNVVFDAIQGPIVPQTGVWAITTTTNSHTMRVYEMRRP